MLMNNIFALVEAYCMSFLVVPVLNQISKHIAHIIIYGNVPAEMGEGVLLLGWG